MHYYQKKIFLYFPPWSTVETRRQKAIEKVLGLKAEKNGASTVISDSR